jgi:hypothetical protein
MKYFTVIYNGNLIGTFSQYQVLNGFDELDWQYIQLIGFIPPLIEKVWQYKFRMKHEMIMPCYSIKIKKR